MTLIDRGLHPVRHDSPLARRTGIEAFCHSALRLEGVLFPGPAESASQPKLSRTSTGATGCSAGPLDRRLPDLPIAAGGRDLCAAL